MNYQVIFHLETKANILSYNCLYVPKKAFCCNSKCWCATRKRMPNLESAPKSYPKKSCHILV